MRRRKRSPAGQAGGNLDSFLDTLTNTVGVLIFVLLFVTLAAADATVLVKTPLRAATRKQEIFFEVTGNRVALLDTDAGTKAYGQLLDGLPRARWYNLDIILNRIYDFSGDAGNHRVGVVGSVLAGNTGLQYELRPGAGDLVEALGDSSSEFQDILADGDTAEQFVAFLVRPDGLEAFREARKHASRRGFQSGWEPIQADAEGVVFSSGGRSVGVQ
jgi:hypothetical protein